MGREKSLESGTHTYTERERRRWQIWFEAKDKEDEEEEVHEELYGTYIHNTNS